MRKWAVSELVGRVLGDRIEPVGASETRMVVGGSLIIATGACLYSGEEVELVVRLLLQLVFCLIVILATMARNHVSISIAPNIIQQAEAVYCRGKTSSQPHRITYCDHGVYQPRNVSFRSSAAK